MDKLVEELKNAVVENDVKKVEKIAELGIISQLTDSNLEFILNEADNLEILKLLMRYSTKRQLSIFLTRELFYNNKNNQYIGLLLKHGADPNYMFLGSTPLLTAIDSNNNIAIITLLQYGASPTLVVDGMSALQYARSRNNRDIVDLLNRVNSLVKINNTGRIEVVD